MTDSHPQNFELQDPFNSVVGYSRVIVGRADPKIGAATKKKLLEICDADTALTKVLKHKFQRHISQTNMGILGSPGFIGQMRAQTLRRFAQKAHLEHEQLQIRLKGNEALSEKPWTFEDEIKEREVRRTLADNPNGFLKLGCFLIKVAALNAEYAATNRLIGIEQVVQDATFQIETDRLQRPHVRQRSQRLLPGC